jgi:hypothetical protein
MATDCSVEGCERPTKAKGLCNTHYLRVLALGSTELPYRPSPEERFWLKVDRRGEDDCWEWLAAKGEMGHGRFWTGSRPGVAHRFSYELLVGPIPDGLELDHLCRNPRCVNPKHLEPVTHVENIHRGAHRMKTHCPQGHEYTPDNIRWVGGTRRSCKICYKVQSYAATKRRRAREKAEREAERLAESG